MLSFEDVLKEFDIFLQTASYLEVLPCRWGYVRLFNEGDPINFYAVLCRTPQELTESRESGRTWRMALKMSKEGFCFPFSILAIYFTETLLFSAS